MLLKDTRILPYPQAVREVRSDNLLNFWDMTLGPKFEMRE
jgi:hypothetical protein